MEEIVKIVKLKFKKKVIFETIERNISPNINIFYYRPIAILHNRVKFIN